MPRRFETTSTFAAGAVSEEYYHRPNIESVQNAAKDGLNVVLNKAGGVETRAPFTNTIPAWVDIPADSRCLPFKGLDDDWAIIFKSTKVSLINAVRVDVVNISQGTKPNINAINAAPYGGTNGDTAYFEAAALAAADVPVDNAPSYVQIENTMLIASYGSPVVSVTWNDSTSKFDVQLAKFYVEASGVGVELTNGSTTVQARSAETLDTSGASPTQLEQIAAGLTRWNTEFTSGDTVRIAGRNMSGTVSSTAAAGDTIVMSTGWTGPTVMVPTPPAYILNKGHSLGTNAEGLLFARGVALYQGRLVFIADSTDGTSPREPRPLSVIMSSTYDPYVISASPQILGQRPNAPIDIDLRVGNERELMWVVGGDSLVIGGQLGEYSLVDPRTPLNPENPGSIAFRKMSNYGSTTESAVLNHDGHLIFSPTGGGKLLSVKYVETNDKFAAGNLAPLNHDLVASARSLEVYESTAEDPVTRLFLITENNELRIGSFTDLLDVPGWFAQSLGTSGAYPITMLEVLEINNTIYLYVKRPFGTNDHTFLKYDIGANAYTMDLQETCTGSGPTDTWTYADAYTVGTSGTNDIFTITTKDYVKYPIVSGDLDDVTYNQVLTATSGGSGNVHEIGTDYVVLRTPSGTIAAGDTFTGSGGVSLVITSTSADITTATHVKAQGPDDSTGSTVVLSYDADGCKIGWPYSAWFDPLNVQSQDELGPTINRKRRVLSARLRHRSTRNYYIQNIAALTDQVMPMEAEVPLRSGIGRRTFLGGWRTEDDFRVQNVVPYRFAIDDLTREVAG